MKDCINLKEEKFLAVSIYFILYRNNDTLGIDNSTH